VNLVESTDDSDSNSTSLSLCSVLPNMSRLYHPSRTPSATMARHPNRQQPRPPQRAAKAPRRRAAHNRPHIKGTYILRGACRCRVRLLVSHYTVNAGGCCCSCSRVALLVQRYQHRCSATAAICVLGGAAVVNCCSQRGSNESRSHLTAESRIGDTRWRLRFVILFDV